MNIYDDTRGVCGEFLGGRSSVQKVCVLAAQYIVVCAPVSPSFPARFSMCLARWGIGRGLDAQGSVGLDRSVPKTDCDNSEERGGRGQEDTYRLQEMFPRASDM